MSAEENKALARRSWKRWITPTSSMKSTPQISSGTSPIEHPRHPRSQAVNLPLESLP